jgi:6-phospho-3-hexuloisomerase
MMIREALNSVSGEVRDCLSRLDQAEMEAALEALHGAPRVFVAGAGRSGLAMCAFAMRLTHLGLSTYVIGEMVTPAFDAGDVLVIGSGSGRTESLLAVTRKAKALGGRIVLFTIGGASPLAELAEVMVRIPAPSPKAQVARGSATSVQPMGSLFEQSLFLLGDALILLLMERREVTAGAMFERHANLE